MLSNKFLTLTVLSLLGLLVVGTHAVRAEPGTVLTSSGPALGADPPKGRNIEDGDYSVATNTGALQYRYPLELPAGRLGQAPALALGYSSQGAIRGTLSSGWVLDIPSIRLEHPDGTMGEPQYISTMAGGQRLVQVNEPASLDATAWRAEQDDSYMRYERTSDGQWIARATDGTVYHFGPPQSLLSALMQEWHISRIEDPYGNTIEYFYHRVALSTDYIVDLSVEAIEYTSNPVAGLGAHARVEFLYAPSLELCGESNVPVGASHSSRSFKRLRGAEKLTDIKVLVKDTQGATWTERRRYHLDYDAMAADCNQAYAPFRQLSSVTESAWSPDGTLTQLAPVTFEYGAYGPVDLAPTVPDPMVFPTDVLAAGERNLGVFGTEKTTPPTVRDMLIDLDGDGRTDVLLMEPYLDRCQVAFWKNIGNGEFRQEGHFELPTIPWLEHLYRDESAGERCSLAGQLTKRTHYVPPQSTPPPTDCGYCDKGEIHCGWATVVDLTRMERDTYECYRREGSECTDCLSCGSPGTPTETIGSFYSYRFLDLDGDALPDLVTAINVDRSFYDPIIDERAGLLAGPGDTCGQAPPIPTCVTDFDVLTDPTGGTTTLVPTAVGDCGVRYMANTGGTDVVTPCPESGMHRRAPEKRCGGYLWRIYKNLGGGEFDPTPEFRYQPLPLDSNAGDSAIGPRGNRLLAGLHGYLDLDGDNLLDAVVSCRRGHTNCEAIGDGSEILTQMFKGDGNGHFLPPDGSNHGAIWEFPKPGGPYTTEPWKRRPTYTLMDGDFVDIDGDQLVDFVVDDYPLAAGPDGRLEVYFNNGKGFASSPKTLAEISDSLQYMYVIGTGEAPDQIGTMQFSRRALDLDGDGLIDVAVSPSLQNPGVYGVYRNFGDTLSLWRFAGTGFGGLLPTQYSPLQRYTDVGNVAGYPWAENRSWSVRTDMLDIDGDGLLEHIDATAYGVGNTVRLSPPKTGDGPRLLHTIRNGAGLVVTAQYASIHDTTGPAVDGLGRSPGTRWVVSSLDINPGFSRTQGNTTTTYAYSDPVFNQDRHGRYAFRGFKQATTNAPLGSQTVETFDYQIDWSGRKVEARSYATANDESSIRSITQTDWQQASLFGAAVDVYLPVETRSWVCKDSDTVTSCQLSEDHLRRKTTQWDPVLAGPERVAYWGAVSTDGEGSTDSPGDRRRESAPPELRYAADEYRLLGVEDSDFVLDDGLLKQAYARTKTYYDTVGLPEATEVWQDGQTITRTEHGFDSAGNVNAVKSPRLVADGGLPGFNEGSFVLYTHDSHQLFVATTTIAANHVTSTDYDVATGALLSQRGPNSLALNSEEDRFIIDGLGRVLERHESVDAGLMYQPFLIEKNTYFDHEFVNNGTPNYVRNEKVIDYGGTDWITIESQKDGAGQLTQVTTLRTAPGASDTVEIYWYDVVGNLRFLQTPDASSDTAAYTVYWFEYDTLGRPLRSYRLDSCLSGSQASYDGLVKTTSEVTCDASGASTRTTADVFGQLLQVEELSQRPDTWTTTTYVYETPGRLGTIIDPQGVVTNITNDWTDNRTSITRTGRTWSYQYDLNGNMVAETSPGSPAVDFTTTTSYDDLDRPKMRKPAGRGMAPATQKRLGIGEIQYHYDWLVDRAASNPRGRLVRVVLPFGNVDYDYDAQGRVITEGRSFEVSDPTLVSAPSVGDTRFVSTVYNAMGAPVSASHADDSRSYYEYDDRGLLVYVGWDDPNSGLRETIAEYQRNFAGLVTRRETGYDQYRTVAYDTFARPIDDHVFDKNEYSCPGGVCGYSEATRGWWQPTYSDSGDIKTLSTHRGDFVFGYDARHQLVSARGANNNPGPYGYQGDFTYSPAGRLSRVTATWNAAGSAPPALVRDVNYDYSYGAPPDPEAVGRLISDTNDVFATYAYDPIGNLATRVLHPLMPNEHTVTFTYDGEDQVREVYKEEGGSTLEEVYYYDHAGQRMLSIRPGENMRFFMAGSEIETPANGVNPTTKTHISGSGTSIARITDGSALELLYHATRGDMLLALDGAGGGIDTNGNVKAEFVYGPFGEVLYASGTSADSHTRRFNDKEHDELTGLVYYGFRYYDPSSLTWTQADPLYRFAPDLAYGEPRRGNLYVFSLNNPITYIDPDGRDSHTTINETATYVSYTGYGDYFTVRWTNGDDSGELEVSGENVVETPIRGTTASVVGKSGVFVPTVIAPNNAPRLWAGLMAAKYGYAQDFNLKAAYGQMIAFMGIAHVVGKQALEGLSQSLAGGGQSAANLRGAGQVSAGSRVNLASHEAAGGHTIARHVGRSATQLDARLAAQPSLGAASSFTSQAQAEVAASRVLGQNNAAVSQWVSAGAQGRLAISGSSPYGIMRIPGGYSVSPTGATVVLNGDGSGSFYILTSYPTAQ